MERKLIFLVSAQVFLDNEGISLDPVKEDTEGKTMCCSVPYQLGQAQSWAPSHLTPFDPHNILVFFLFPGTRTKCK